MTKQQARSELQNTVYLALDAGMTSEEIKKEVARLLGSWL